MKIYQTYQEHNRNDINYKTFQKFLPRMFWGGFTSILKVKFKTD